MDEALKILLALALSGTSSAAFAKKKPPSASQKTIDLEAGIIKGRRLRPKIFLEFESSTPPVSAVIFKREDFNDYHEQDVKARLRFILLRKR